MARLDVIRIAANRLLEVISRLGVGLPARPADCRDCCAPRPNRAAAGSPRENVSRRPRHALAQAPRAPSCCSPAAGSDRARAPAALLRTHHRSALLQIHVAQIGEGIRIGFGRKSDSLFERLRGFRESSPSAVAAAASSLSAGTKLGIAPQRLLGTIGCRRRDRRPPSTRARARSRTPARAGRCRSIACCEPGNAGCEIRALLHLRHGQIQFVLRCRRQLRADSRGDLAAIVAMREAVSLGTLGQQIARRPLTLNVVVRHHHVNRVFRAPLRHMAVDTGGARSDTLDLRRAAAMRLLMAALTNRHVTLHRCRAARNVVRVVAGDARHLAALKTRRLAQAVCAAGNLELVVAATPGRVIEMNEVVAERLSGCIRKRRMLVAANLKRQWAARRFEVALHARLELPFAVERSPGSQSRGGPLRGRRA